jgi:hypothetical protein
MRCAEPTNLYRKSEMWDTTAFDLRTLEPNRSSEAIDGCPRFAPAYLGRKRWAQPNDRFSPHQPLRNQAIT